jgi:hypothetical protein
MKIYTTGVCATCPHRLGYYLTSGSDYAVADSEGTEETFKIVLELPDDIPDKADLLDNCAAFFSTSFLNNNNQKEDIDKCILAYELAIHLTPLGHSDMSKRLNLLGGSLLSRFSLAGDFTDISDAISHLQKAVHLTPEGHADMPSWLNNLGNSFQRRFECTGDLADI